MVGVILLEMNNKSLTDISGVICLLKVTSVIFKSELLFDSISRIVTVCFL